jgi:hypothetical protein
MRLAANVEFLVLNVEWVALEVLKSAIGSL